MNAPLTPEQQALIDNTITLDDKYTLERGRAFMTGTQALIRLMMLQRQADEKAGLNTAGFISGYRGSPLGNVDLTAAKAKKHLSKYHVKFHPGVNEDLAATSVWGTQQANLFPGAKYDGVFAMWYGQRSRCRPLRRRVQARQRGLRCRKTSRCRRVASTSAGRIRR